MKTILGEKVSNSGLKNCEIAFKAGLNTAAFSSIKNGWNKPSYKTANKIAKALNCNVEELWPGIKLLGQPNQ